MKASFIKLKTVTSNVLRYTSDRLFPLYYSKYAHGIKTVGILLGPYRNLTTLAASILALHPNCQVLNHAGKRVFGNSSINFLDGYNKNKFKKFLNFSIYASLYGRRGSYGGGIFHAHAFDSKVLKNKYYDRFSSHRKKNIQCLFWKESQIVSNKLKNIDIEHLLNENDILKFILPVRNPVRCALSNIRTNHCKYLENSPLNLEECLHAIYKEFVFFLKLKHKYPNRFFYFFEDEFYSILPKLAIFLKLQPDKRWLNDASDLIILKKKDLLKTEMIDMAKSLAIEYFEPFPKFKNRIIEIINE